MPTKHAILSPSSSKRWLTCTPSAVLEAAEPEESSVFAQEGTIAHGIAEALLNEFLSHKSAGLPDSEDVFEAYKRKDVCEDTKYSLKEWEAEAAKIGANFCDIFCTVWDNYCKIVLEDFYTAQRTDKNTELFVEAELALDLFIPDGFGSSDAIIITGNTLKVYDLKFGKGVKVDAFHNTQMQCYAIGALYGPGEPYNIDFVEMTIIQPRLNHVSTWRVTEKELVYWAFNTLKPTAGIASRGEGRFIPGEHCKFCKLKGRCEALAKFAQVEVLAGGDPQMLSLDSIGQALNNLEVVRTYVMALEEFAMKSMLSGKNITGWKIVEGRSLRKISDTNGAIEALTNIGWKEEDCYKPRELKPIGDLEKMVGKKNYQAVLGGFTVKTPGKPIIAPENDPRPCFSPAENDFSQALK